MPRIKDLTGQVFGRLTVLGMTDRRVRGYVVWSCECACGGFKEVITGHLKGGTISSCGCLRREHAASIPKKVYHGHSRRGEITSEYHSWSGASARCNNPKDKRYKDYGGRGIKFLFDSFEDFFEELGPRPEGTTLNRIDNDGNYEPGNVEWATLSKQAQNRRPRKLKPPRQCIDCGKLAKPTSRGRCGRCYTAAYRKGEL